jgi:hypothetical protein
MIGAWTMNVGGRIYGPFSTERMRSFASEGRLAASSLIARERGSDWRKASEEPEFADLFPQPQPEQSPAPAEERPILVPDNPPTSAPAPEAPEAQRSQFAVVVDLKSHSSGNLEKAILALGPAYKLLPNVWIVSSDQSVNAVRNRLIQELGKADTLFVVDASRGKAAWFNFGPEADARIRRVWQKAS